MRRILITMATAGLVVLSFGGTAIAQDDGPPGMVPVELWACSYRDGMDRSDFDDALEELTDWYAENPDEPYNAWVLSPQFRGANMPFDIIYLGAWPDGATFGRNYTAYGATGGDADEAWDEAVDCNNALLFASFQVRPPNPSGDGNFVLTVSDCNLAKGRQNSQAVAAINRFANYRDNNGAPGSGTFIWYPVFGGGDAEYNFKIVNGYSGWEDLGNYLSWFGDNEVWNVTGNLFNGLMDCDEARAYNGETVMNTWPGDQE